MVHGSWQFMVPSTSGITEIGNYGYTEKPEGPYDGYAEGRNLAAEQRNYGNTELRI